MHDDSSERHLRRLFAESAIRPADEEFSTRVARRIAQRPQLPAWPDFDRIVRIILPIAFIVTAWVVMTTLVSALSPVFSVVTASSVGTMLTVAVATLAVVYTWLKA